MAKFFEGFKKFFSSPAYSSNGNFLKLKIKCAKCSEEINVNLRRTSDFSRVYEGEGAPSGTAFFVRKEILGNNCNNLIHISVYLDENYNIVSRDIHGGEFL